MRHFILSTFIFISSCSSLVPISDNVEKMVDNDAITVKVDKDAINPQTDVNVSVQVTNKETVK